VALVDVHPDTRDLQAGPPRRCHVAREGWANRTKGQDAHAIRARVYAFTVPRRDNNTTLRNSGLPASLVGPLAPWSAYMVP
jgi:hypothetical protein